VSGSRFPHAIFVLVLKQWISSYSADEAVLTPLLFRLTSSKSLPIVIVSGKVVAVEDLVALDASGDLTDRLEAAGAVVDGLPAKFRKQVP
jgi:hypothetical protein